MEEAKNLQINISASTIVKAVIVLAVAAVIYYLRDVVVVLLTAVVVASSINPAANWLTKFKIPRAVSVLIIYIAASLIILGTLLFFVPLLSQDFSGLVFKIPAQINNLVASNPSWGSFLSLFGDFSTKLSVQDVVGSSLLGSSLPTNAFDLTSWIFSGALDFILVIVISFYLAVQKNGVENFLRIIIPSKKEDYIIDLWKRTEVKIGRWMQGQILLGLLIGPLVFLGLTLFQIKYALTLAIVAAIFEIIPIFGPILSAVPAVILGFTDSVTLGIIMVGFYVIIQQFENHLIYPLVVKKVIGVNPIIVIIALFVGYELAGFLGIILAVPMATLLMEFISDIEKHKHANV